MTIIQTSLETIFKTNANAVTVPYTPLGGSAADLVIIPTADEEDVELFNTALQIPTFLFDVLVSALPSPTRGSTLTWNGQVYTVTRFSRRDPHQLIWTIETSRGV